MIGSRNTKNAGHIGACYNSAPYRRHNPSSDETLAQCDSLQERIIVKRTGDLNHLFCPIPQQ